jgi:hypothetical protein
MKYFEAWKKNVDDQMIGARDQWGNISGFPGVIESIAKKGGPFVDWSKLQRPQGPGNSNLENYLFVASVYFYNEYGKFFLDLANEASERALNDERFDIDPEKNGPPKFTPNGPCLGWKIEGVYPGSHGETLAAACFSRALRDDGALSSVDLLQASDEIEETSLFGGTSSWDTISQSRYLRCVRLCLLAGNSDKAQFLLKNIRRKFKHTSVHHQWLQEVCNAIEVADKGSLASESVENFEVFFDEVRNPEFRSLPTNEKDGTNLVESIYLLHFELACIRQKYILQQPLAGHWKQVLASISE